LHFKITLILKRTSRETPKYSNMALWGASLRPLVQNGYFGGEEYIHVSDVCR